MKIYYFGPYSEAGHYFFGPHGCRVSYAEERTIPWTPGQIDGGLQPHTCGCPEKGESCYRGTCAPIGKAKLHHKDGWTALSFWDSSVDTRGGCNSSVICEGIHTFEFMVDNGKRFFPERWARMNFEVTLFEPK